MTQPRNPPIYAPVGNGLAAKEWESYVAAVYPTGGVVPNHQLIETRRAFYAGGWAMLNKGAELVSGSGAATAEELAAVVALRDELEAFSEAVASGRA